QPARTHADLAVGGRLPGPSRTESVNIFGAMLVAVLIGAVLPLQGLINARLGTHLGGPVVAAFVSVLVGTAMLGAYLLATRTPVLLQGSLKLPAWVWAGGVFGAIYVA